LNFFNARKYINFHWYGNYEIKKHLKPILWLFAMAVSIEIYTVLDTTMLGFLKGDEAVGIYSAAIKINKLSISLITSLGVVLIPRLSYYVGQRNNKQFLKLVNMSFNFVFMFSIPSCIGLGCLNKEIIRIFCGNGFDKSSLTMKLLTPIVIIIPFSEVVNNQILVSLGKEKLILFSTCVGAVTNFIFNSLLIPKYSYNGAAVATVIAEAMVAVICFINIKRILNLSNIFNEYYKYWIAVIPLPLIIRFIQWLKLGDIITVLISVVMSVCIYFVILILVKNTYIFDALKVAKKKLKS
jgi:O-antigen/teichoic acid export membrane protein